MTVFVNLFRQDTFIRGNISGNSNVATGWGTASDGISTWTAMSGSAAATYSIASNEGHVTGVNNADFDVYLGGTLKDTEVVVRLTASSFGDDAGGVYLRFIDANNFYRCFLTGSQLVIDKKVSGSFTGGIGTASFTATSGTYYFIRFHALGTNLMARAWQSGSSEPGTWNINITDSDITSAGHVGLGANMALTSETISFDSFAAYYPQNTDTIGLRSRVRSQVTKTMGLRSLVRSLNTKTVGLRAIVSGPSTVTKWLPLRARIMTAVSRLLPLRAVIRNQKTAVMPLRVVVRVPIPPTYPTNGKYTVLVNKIPYFVVAGSLTVDNAVGKRGQAAFYLHTDLSTHFQQYEQVWIYDQNGNLAFSGYLDIPIKETKPGFQPSLVHELTAMDQHYLADKRVVSASYTNKTCGYIAQDLLNTILVQEGVTRGAIYDGLTPSLVLYPSPQLYPGGNVGLIPQATFTLCTVAQALDALVKAASQSGVPYYWLIDQYKQLWFVPYSYVINNTLVDGTAIEQVNNVPYVQRANPLYRNTDYITGGVAQTLPQTETRQGDGKTTTFTMSFDLALAPTITLNSNPQTVGVKGVDSGKNWYWQQGSPDIVQDSGGTKLVSTDTLSVSYTGQYPNTSVASNAAQIDYQASLDGSSGIVEVVDSDPTITSAANALDEASQMLTRYAVQGTQLVFTTLKSGYAMGQYIPVNLPEFNLNNVQMLVAEVSGSDQSDSLNIWYTVTAVSGPYDTSWVDFFSTLLKTPQKAGAINVGTTQSSEILVSLTGGVTLSANLTANVYACPIPATTLYPSTSSLYPC